MYSRNTGLTTAWASKRSAAQLTSAPGGHDILNRQAHQDASMPLSKTSFWNVVDKQGGKWGCLGAHALRKMSKITMQLFEIIKLTGFLIIVIFVVNKGK